MIRTRRAAALAAALLAVLLLSGCRLEEEPARAVHPTIERTYEGPPRAYRLGFSATPHELTDEAYLETFDFAALHGETLLIHRAPLWDAFLPSVPSAPQEVRDALVAEREAAQARGLALIVALDVFDPAARDRLHALPGEYLGRGLDDRDLRRALVAEALFVARNERPAMLVIGSEVNATFERDPVAFERYLAVYREIYDEVKALAPEILVFPSFQYEELLGVIPWQPPHAPRWDLLDQFGERIDAFAITTYPSFAYQVARKVPPRYYAQAAEHTALPLLFLSVGYASGSSREGFNASTAPEQRRFLQRLLAEVEALRSPLLVWFVARDLAFATAPPYDLLGTIGLFDLDNQAKEAWPAWLGASRRPYDPDAPPLATPTPTPTPTPDGTPADGAAPDPAATPTEGAAG